MLTTPFLARNITFSAVFFFCMNEFDDEFLFLTERPLFAAFILLLLRPFLLLEQIEGSLIVMHQKFKRGFDLQKGLRK